jgi:predicted phosphodiesterase
LDLFHGSPRQPLIEYVYPEDFPKVGPGFWDQTGADVILLGHTHLPAQHFAGDKLLGNPGSVGQPRDGDPRSSYAILDPKKRRMEFKRVSYDIEAAAEANLDAGLPEFLASRLIAGK